ncbi:MAG: pantoate--beta-alanine ligase [Peptostreptococcus sp.]|uniref:pantoate--beta-alanine ligase n=1 Tax=Peptostreptococcus sp. TaxID=1262 RepID=UPI002FCB1294
MKIIKTIEEMKSISRDIYFDKKTMGLVPTMGYLHEGHKSLIAKAKEDNDLVVVSIFVNPTQFAPEEDLENYPRDLQRDAKICEELKVDYIFHPKEGDMYRENFSTFVVPGENMTDIMCGVTRPAHFKGVCTVLTKIFNIVSPQKAYFGEKDIQQLAIVKRMVEDMNFDIDIVGCPIVREDDGLAKSSRNTYLDSSQRKAATILRKSILRAKEMIDSGEKDAIRVQASIIEMIEEEPLAKIDYIEILDFETFERLKIIQKRTLISMAVYIGKTRLIDNMVIDLND